MQKVPVEIFIVSQNAVTTNKINSGQSVFSICSGNIDNG